MKPELIDVGRPTRHVALDTEDMTAEEIAADREEVIARVDASYRLDGERASQRLRETTSWHRRRVLAAQNGHS